MERPSYLSKYFFDWNMLGVVLDGKSSLDTKSFVGRLQNKEAGKNFLKGYGFDPEDPVSTAELFGNFQEALQFIRRYFLIEGNPSGLDFKIPNSLYMVNEINDLFILASTENSNAEERLWAEIVLKVMHTVLHVDKDLRSKYFSVIQTQIFDRFYRHIKRDSDNRLYLGVSEQDRIELINFETKDKKSRDSVIIKLLHKVENVAEELFDRVGVRFVTINRFDTLRVVKFLLEKNIIIPQNVKPSRSLNTLVNLDKFKSRHKQLLKLAIRNHLSEDRLLQAMERESDECSSDDKEIGHNLHTAKYYKSIQFTCRQLIKYINPFFHEFQDLRKSAKALKTPDDKLVKKIMSMNMSLIAGEIRFFYPFEIQVVDQQSHEENTVGRSSHQEYKKAQLESAMERLFKRLLDYKRVS